MNSIATHSATVTSVEPGRVRLTMHVASACSSCQAKGRCGFAEGTEKEVVVDTPDYQHYAPGDAVVVSVNESNGLKAVLVAYILPSVIILTAVPLCAERSEWLAIVVAFLALAAYALLLYLFRNKIQKKYTFLIHKKQ